MKKICMLTSGHSPYDDRIFYKEAKALVKAGYEVSIVVSTGHYREVTDGISINGFNVPHFWVRLLVGRVYAWFVFVCIGLKIKANVYHCHEPGLLIPAFVIKLINKFIWKEKVYIIHEIRDFYLSETLLDKKGGFLRSVVTFMLECWDRLIHPMCDHVIGVEESKVERVFSYGISPEKISVIENYVPLDLFKFYPREFNGKDFVLGYAGGLSFERGIDKLVKACVEFSKKEKTKTTLVLLGRFFSQKEEEWVLEYFDKNRAFIDLEISGWIPHTEVSKRLSSVDICFALFYSNRYEKVLSGKAGPIKLYEYMACGRPVIATNCRALNSTISGANCGIVIDPVLGVEAIVGAIEFYYRNPRQMIRDGERGRLAVESNYNWNMIEDKFLSIYQNLGAGVSL